MRKISGKEFNQMMVQNSWKPIYFNDENIEKGSLIEGENNITFDNSFNYYKNYAYEIQVPNEADLENKGAGLFSCSKFFILDQVDNKFYFKHAVKYPYYLNKIRQNDKELCENILKERPPLIKQIKENVDSKILVELVQDNKDYIKYIQDFDEDIIIEFLKEDGNLLKHIENQTTKMCFAAIRQNNDAFSFIQNKTFDLCLEAFDNDPEIISYIQNLDIIKDLIELKLKQFQYFSNKKLISIQLGKLLRRLSNSDRYYFESKYAPFIIPSHGWGGKKFIMPSRKQILEYLKVDGNYLEIFENQTEEMCLEAVKQNGLALEFVKRQTLEICQEAYNQNTMALKFIKEEFLPLLKEPKNKKETSIPVYDSPSPYKNDFKYTLLEDL